MCSCKKKGENVSKRKVIKENLSFWLEFYFVISVTDFSIFTQINPLHIYCTSNKISAEKCFIIIMMLEAKALEAQKLSITGEGGR